MAAACDVTTCYCSDLDLCDISDNVLKQRRGDGGERDRNASALILDQSNVYELVRIGRVASENR